MLAYPRLAQMKNLEGNMARYLTLRNLVKRRHRKPVGPRKHVASHLHGIRKHEAIAAHGAAFRRRKCNLHARIIAREWPPTHHASVQARTKARKRKRLQHKCRTYRERPRRIARFRMLKRRGAQVIETRRFQIGLGQSRKQVDDRSRSCRMLHVFPNANMSIEQFGLFHNVEAFAAYEQQVDFQKISRREANEEFGLRAPLATART